AVPASTFTPRAVPDSERLVNPGANLSAVQQKCCTAQHDRLYQSHDDERRAERNAVKHKDGNMPKFVKADSVGNVEFPSFDASKATDQVRAFAEKGLEQSKEVYAKV